MLSFDEIVDLKSILLTVTVLNVMYPKPNKNFSKILLINIITTEEQRTITNLIYPKLEPLIKDFNQ